MKPIPSNTGDPSCNIPVASASGISVFVRRFPFVLSLTLLVSSASAEVYQWNGGASGVWSNAANWNPTGTPSGITAGPAATGGNFNHRLNVNNGSANALVYTTTLGVTVYGGTGIRGLVLGSGSAGAMRITGGTFDTTNSDSFDVVGSGSAGSLTIEGGSFKSNQLQMGLNNGSGSGTLHINGGASTIGSIQFNYQSAGGSATIHLNAGSLNTNQLVESATGANGNHLINFNGGTLIAGPSAGNLIPAVFTRANVRDGGAKVDSNGRDITIAQPLVHSTISGDAAIDGGLEKIGSGRLTLTAVNTFNGGVSVQGGTLALAASASISGSSGVTLSSAAALDVSAVPDYFWPPLVPLTSAGGILKGGNSLNLGTVPLELKFTPTAFNGDSTHPALNVSGGSLTLNGPLTVTNQAASPLGVGNYVLISQSSGTITGTPSFNGTVAGQGIQPGKYCYLEIIGGTLQLAVRDPSATSITLARQSGIPASSVYGDALSFIVTISPPDASGSVDLFNGGIGGTLIGSATLSNGTAVFTPSPGALAPGTHSAIVARFNGSPGFSHSTSSALSPSQSVSVKILTLADAAALDKPYDASTVARIAGTLTGIVPGDTVFLNPTGVFATANPGTGIAVTSTATLGGASAARYAFTQPTGLSASIFSSNIWTGGAGGIGTNLATGTNYSPAATPTNPFNAVFNGSDPATTDLTLPAAIGGAIGTSGMSFAFSGAQTNPVTLTGSSGGSARVSSILVAAGAGPVTFSALPLIMGGPPSNTSHSITNESANPLVFTSGGNWIPGGSDSSIRSLLLGGVGDITMASNIAPSVPARMLLSKSGTGTLTLSGSNTFSGGTTLAAGRIIATTSTALGSGPVVNEGVLDLTAGSVTYSGLSSSLSGNGLINATLGTGTGTTLLNGNYSAFTGTWNLGIGAAAGAGKVQMNGADNPAAIIRVLENATLYTTAGTHNATLYLHGGNTGESLGQLRIEGTANWAGNVILAGPITGPGDGAIGANAGNGLISGPIGEINGPQSLAKEGGGTVTLTGTNTYTGPTLVEQGALLLNSPGSLHAASAVTVSNAARLAGTGTIHGPVLVESGGTLGGSLTLHGVVTVSAGGILDATDVSLPSVNATHSLTLAGFLNLSIDRTRNPRSSTLAIAGNLVRGGTLRVVNTGPELQLGDSFTLSVSAGNVSGAFVSTLLPALGYGLAWNTSQFAANGTITVVANTGFTNSTTTLTPATTNQQIHGIGANFCLGPQSIAWNTTSFNQAFSPDGLNISFARLSNSFECALDEPEIFWSGWDSDNVRFIQMFRAIQPNGLLTISSWSPPGRFKSTGSANGGTLAKTGNAYRYADFANWWLRSLQYLRDNSTLPVEKAIPDFISIQNECDFTPSGNPFYAPWQAGCYLDSTESSTKAGYPQALAAIKSAFQANGFGFVQFVGPDTTTASPSVISSYLNNVPANSFAAIAHHPYQGSVNNNGYNIGSLTGLRTAYPNSTIYMTEFFGDDPYGPGVPAWMMHALPMHNVFALEKANTYLMWGLSVLPTAASYCALGHYSKFINPGDWRSAASTTDPNVVVSLYRRTGAPGVPQQLVLVMINKSASYSYQTIQTSAHWAADPDRRLWQVYKTADDGSTSQRLTLTEDLAGSALTGNRNLVIAPYSVTTVLINSDAPLSNQETWRQQHFGTPSNLGNAADNFDADKDGESNFYEFATGQNPLDGTLVSPSVSVSGANIEFTYTRGKSALLDGVTFTVEWSDTMEAGSWFSTGIANQNPAPIAQDANTATLRILVPAGSGKRFVRLKVVKP